MHPSYHQRVKPLLTTHKGDPGELLRRYPTFNPEGNIPDTLFDEFVSELVGEEIKEEFDEGNWLRWPYLHFACSQDHIYAAQGLLRCGADPLRKEKFFGGTPLSIACRHEPKGCALLELLLQYTKANINWKGINGIAPLHSCILREHIEQVELLLQYGADPTLLYESPHEDKSTVDNAILELIFDGHSATPYVDLHGNVIVLNKSENDDDEKIICTPVQLSRQGELSFEVFDRSLPRSHMHKLKDTLPKGELTLLLEFYEHMWNTGEWRPWNHASFPTSYRTTMRTLVVLARLLEYE